MTMSLNKVPPLSTWLNYKLVLWEYHYYEPTVVYVLQTSWCFKRKFQFAQTFNYNLKKNPWKDPLGIIGLFSTKYLQNQF